MFIEPMYAQPLPNPAKNPKAKPFILEPGLIVAEEKYDGIRLCSQISKTADRLFIEKGIKCWSRYGNLDPVGHMEHIEQELAKLPDCYIDGELLVPGKRSYGTMTLANNKELVYYVFDILSLEGIDLTPAAFHSRREVLEGIFKSSRLGEGSVRLAKSTPVDTWEDVYALRDEVYARDGEGLILKRIDSGYYIGKRPKNQWIKIKKLQSQVFTVTGFEQSRGQIVDRGPCGMTKLRSPEGVLTQVKTKNDALCREAESLMGTVPHPWIGRRLWCEYQELTPYGEYRHLRWDHWDKE
jgi:ATP-dependent DNA ligase